MTAHCTESRRPAFALPNWLGRLFRSPAPTRAMTRAEALEDPATRRILANLSDDLRRDLGLDLNSAPQEPTKLVGDALRRHLF
ncbi:hypothetical protein [Paracoccus sulfuroxidans]|uniref:DUF1127 domain-containing protein n=1 Tax=Paracoccus sulfuroxidans TaxID=384678 RepID=A0A562NC21_9RHOB|nr:hypothetical protein [Paracoccus sulfuroxidans]TWI29653.1 hypothetical protein IQ24_03467 [Paracoccus sulfuroxidans]